MYYYDYKRRFPENILVYVEDFNKKNGTVLLDFFDSNEYEHFSELANLNYNLYKPSMVMLTNYKGKTIRENTIYAIRPETIQYWVGQNAITNNDLDSFLIGYNIDVENNNEQIFNESVSINGSDDLFDGIGEMYGGGNISNLSFQYKGKISVTIRNVGQGNWNEINFNDKVEIVYDAGAPLLASRASITSTIANRNTLYPISKPTLVLSHWDKDHYHSLIGMSDVELQNNFSAFICRDRVPNITSRLLLGKIRDAVGFNNTYCIPANPRTQRGGPTFFSELTSSNNQVVLYNSQKNKDINVSGLALTVKTQRNSVVLPADAHYEQISRDILPHLNYNHKHHCIVPHHGGKAGKYQYITPQLVSLGKAIISVGTNNYGHPFANNILSLKQSGFTVKQTNRIASDITISL